MITFRKRWSLIFRFLLEKIANQGEKKDRKADQKKEGQGELNEDIYLQRTISRLAN
jgi:hypothetical protein